MRRSFLALALPAALLLACSLVQAADGTAQNFQVNNRLRVGYDDNVYETDSDTTDSFKIIEEIELILNFSLERSYVGLRYRPSYEYWDNRDPDNDDFHHNFDLILTHEFTPRLSISAKDTYIYSEQPQLMDRGVVVQDQGNYSYNLADAALVYQLQPETRVDVGGRYTLLRYDESEVADNNDYDIYAGGVTLRRQMSGATAGLLEYRYEDVQYEAEERGSTSQFGGLGVEKTFNPNLVANARAGYQFKEFESSGIDSESAPYADASITLMPSPATRITGGAGYSMYEADVYPFASQDRTLLFLSLAYDMTARVSWYLSGSYQSSEYSSDQSTADVSEDGNEEVAQLSARVSYKVNRNNWLEAGWQYLDLGSDLREDFQRNRVELGWRTSI